MASTNGVGKMMVVEIRYPESIACEDLMQTLQPIVNELLVRERKLAANP